MLNDKQFAPYEVYIKNISKINDFEELTDISYGLTQQLLFKHPKNNLPKIEYKNTKSTFKTSSYSMADSRVENVTLSCSWLTINEYSKKTNKTITEVDKLLKNNALGTTQIDPKTNNCLIIWPQSFNTKSIDELPEPGKKSYTVTMSITALTSKEEDLEDLENFEDIQKRFLSLAHSIGKPEDMHENAENTLYRSCFLLHWTSFEVYIRSVLDEIILKNPEILFNDRQSEKQNISYKDLFHYSNELKSISSLKTRIIENEISKHEGDGKSIHGIINFLKEKLNFTKDPYKGWYNLNGIRKETSYNDLMELKDVRNSLIHDAGFPKSSFFSINASVKNKNGEIIIDNAYYLRARLILKSVSFNLMKLITNKEYEINKGKG